MSASTPERRSMRAAAETFRAALRLGLLSFGGPVAHIEYFRRDYVQRRHWLAEEEFADLVTMSNVLPGPASSQLGMAIGMRRAGLPGLIAAWLGFTLPSAAIMGAAGVLATRFEVIDWVHGLKIAALAVVIAAVISLARISIRTLWSAVIAGAAVIAATLAPVSWMHLVVIVGGALLGWLLVPAGITPQPTPTRTPTRLPLLALALVMVPVLVFMVVRGPLADFLEAIYRSGALVFGGGHVVLPLLEASVVRSGMVEGDAFLAGYGLAQAMPGPLFTFAAYLGGVTHGVLGAMLAIMMIFLPGALLVIAVLPYWSRLRSSASMRSAILGANAAVVGVLASVPFLPITRSAIGSGWDLLVVILALLLILSRKAPVVVIVAACALGGALTAL